MKTKLKFFTFVIAATLVFTSCSDDDTVVDTQKPTITIVEPHTEEEFVPGSVLLFEAVFTDNVELASYKIEIHEDFDEHTHAFNKSSQDLNPFAYEQTFTIPAGRTSFEATQEIAIPAELNGQPISEGAYHLGVFVTDKSGNQQEAFLEIHIEADAEEHVE
ncbi:DUF4625 domain-containing protein [Salinimicrobium xinjiangense]|uniref:DUF4625 domain-containing protein n=1 Tax=Salinimicrobium xinjiangense TaxID=438596 RepID=UPI0003F67BE4|nr:DUF4625 domain-containing protein [Salinimicrobium xinjiangense]